VRLDRPRVIEHTWMSEATRGFESVVTITLEPTAGGTHFALRHAGLPDDDMGQQHKDGWAFCLEAIEARLSGRKTT
jgi:uncharacterized protein YndB with AHSA1/START domain